MINGDLAMVRMLLDGGMKSPVAEMFVHDGEILCGQLAEGVHANFDPGPQVEAETRGFMRFGRSFGKVAFGRAVRESGMSSDEAVAALSRGEWDPFADAEIPGLGDDVDQFAETPERDEPDA
jgi:hypothetical protein